MCLSECIYRKHMDKSTLYVLLFCTTNGRWGLIVALIFAEHLNYAPIRCNYFLLCLQAINGTNSPQERRQLLEMRWKRAWGKRNEWSLWNGNEYFLKSRSAEVYDWNENTMQYQGSAWGTNTASGTEWSENGNHILQAQGQTNNDMFLIFCTTTAWWENLEALRAVQRDKALILCGYYT